MRVQAPATVPISFYSRSVATFMDSSEDLLELFRIEGNHPTPTYTSLWVTTLIGHNSVETFLFLIALKVRYRNRITLLRGNQ